MRTPQPDHTRGRNASFEGFRLPFRGFTPLQSSALSDVADNLGATPMQVALGWLLRRAQHILLIPSTSSLAHLRENLAAAELKLPDEVRQCLDGLTSQVAQLTAIDMAWGYYGDLPPCASS